MVVYKTQISFYSLQGIGFSVIPEGSNVSLIIALSVSMLKSVKGKQVQLHCERTKTVNMIGRSS